MDEKIRKLERLAVQGDEEAQAKLRREYERTGNVPLTLVIGHCFGSCYGREGITQGNKRDVLKINELEPKKEALELMELNQERIDQAYLHLPNYNLLYHYWPLNVSIEARLLLRSKEKVQITLISSKRYEREKRDYARLVRLPLILCDSYQGKFEEIIKKALV